MRDQGLSTALREIHQGRRLLPDAAIVRQQLLTVPLTEVPQKRGWLPPADFRGFTMFSAAKFVTAAAIVALFGGFLLTGVLTMPSGDDVVPAAVTASASPDVEATAAPEPSDAVEATEPPATSVRTDLMPNVELTVEEVEPGVFKVVDDGVRDLVGSLDDHQDPNLLDEEWLLTGLDGSVWLIEDGGLVKLGHKGRIGYPKSSYGYGYGVAADGTAWISSQDRLYSRDGSKWRLRLDAKDRDVEMYGTMEFQLLPDGVVWARLGNVGFQRFDGKRWTDVPSPPFPAGRHGARLRAWLVADDGTAWAGRGDDRGRELYRFDGKQWETVPVAAWAIGDDFVVTPEGKVRFLHDAIPVDDFDPESDLGVVPRIYAESGEDGWARLDVPPVPGWRGGLRPDMARNEPLWVFELAPDGTFWRDLSHVGCRPGTGGLGCEPYVTACDGLARFDDERWTRYLRGLCVAGAEFSPDGSVWVRASTPTPGETVAAKTDEDPSLAGVVMETLELGPYELYVITPEAMAAAG